MEGGSPAPGRSAYRVTLDGRVPLVQNKRGLGLWPIFLNELAAAPFVRADVLLVADAPTFEVLKQRGLLEPYRSPDAAAINPVYYDPDRSYYGTKVIATVIAYHRARGKPVQRWADLLQPELRGKLVMPSPFYSGAAAYAVGVFSRTAGLGWAWIEGLARQDVLTVQGNGAVLRSVANGERPYGVIVDFMAVRARQRARSSEPGWAMASLQAMARCPR